MRDVKVLIISKSFPLSRNELFFSFVFDEVSRLVYECDEVHVVRGGYGQDLVVNGMHIHNLSKANLSSFTFLLKNIRHVPFFGLPSALESYYYSNYAQTSTKLVRKHGIDILHAHLAAPEGFVGCLAKKSIEKPLVVTLHGADILTESTIGYGDRLRKDFAEKVGKVFQCADKVIAASMAVRSEALKVGCPAGKLVHIPNGVDTQRFNTRLDGKLIKKELGIKDRHVVFTLRALVPKNGVEYFVRSAKMVVKKFPKVTFIIGGDGFLRHHLQELTGNLGLSDNIIFTGWISQKALPLYFSACDVFVIPSIIEAFGLVTVEAMACGKPVVGTNVGGIPDTIENAKNGYLVPPRDPQGLAEKILLLLENPALSERMGIEGRRMAEEKFDIDRRIARILNIYRELA